MTPAALATRPETLADEELVAATRAGDDRAFSILYSRHRLPVTRFVAQMVGEQARAEDTVQEAFLAALRRLRETDSAVDFKPWVHQIARNAAIDHLRRTTRVDEVPYETDGVVDPHGPAQVAAGRERFTQLRAAMGELSETHHRAIVMRELEGRSYDEIASTLAMSHSAVESTLFRARRKLASEFEEIDTGRRCRRMTGVIARVADGAAGRRELGALNRHTRHCDVCRRASLAAGVDPRHRGSGLVARVAGFLPLPFLLRRGNGAGQLLGAAGPGAEPIVGGGKAIAVLACAAALAAGGVAVDSRTSQPERSEPRRGAPRAQSPDPPAAPSAGVPDLSGVVPARERREPSGERRAIARRSQPPRIAERIDQDAGPVDRTAAPVRATPPAAPTSPAKQAPRASAPAPAGDVEGPVRLDVPTAPTPAPLPVLGGPRILPGPVGDTVQGLAGTGDRAVDGLLGGLGLEPTR